jgi:hypothetical protein
MECAEYNVNMDQDERSLRVLHQLQADGASGTSGGLDDESNSDEVESVIECGRSGGGGGDTYGVESDLMIRGGGGSVIGINVNGGTNRGSGLEATPSKVPLLLHNKGIGGGGLYGGESGPDLVEMETLEDSSSYHGYSGSGHRSESPNRYHHRPLSEQRVPISLVLVFVVFYIMGGAMVFSIWEEWNFLESAYFCFITLSTIGLGKQIFKPSCLFKIHMLYVSDVKM